jgi:hypothetical protein
MKKTITLSILVSTMLLTSNLYGKAMVYAFQDCVKKSDIIVEGFVSEQTDNSSHNSRKVDSYRKTSKVKVSKVYKGNVSIGDTITVFTHMNFICDTSRMLTQGKTYLLMLKKYESDFADANSGRGMWEVKTDKAGKSQILINKTEGNSGQTYQQFKKNIAWSMAKKPNWPEKPTVTYEQAKKIALNIILEEKFDLMGYVYKENKTNPLKIGSEILGVAHKNDLMWYCRWEKPRPDTKKHLPSKEYAAIYVHAYTGNFQACLSKKNNKKTWTGEPKTQTDKIINLLENADIKSIATTHSQHIGIYLKDGTKFSGKYVQPKTGKYSNQFDILNLATHIQKKRNAKWMVMCE